MKKLLKNRGGFTLIEILVVIGIIAILAAVVLVAINPARQFAQARDSQRNSNVNAILNAIGQRIADNKGNFAGSFKIGPAGSEVTYYCGKLPISVAVPGVGTEIKTTKLTAADDLTQESPNLGCLIPTYIPDFPYDPSQDEPTAVNPGIGYKVYVDGSGRVHVLTDEPEESISRTDPIEIIR